MPIDRTNFNALVDDDGSNTVGTPWNKHQIKIVILDPVDAALTTGGATLPINLATDVTGTLQAVNTPAYAGGDVTSPAGSLTLTIGNGKVTAAKLASTIPASTFLPAGGVVLTDGASVPLDASLRASYYRLVAAGNRTINAPTSPSDGQKIIIQHVASGAARTLTLSALAGGFRFGSDIPGLTPTLSGLTDYIGAIYNGAAGVWDVIAYTKGF